MFCLKNNAKKNEFCITHNFNGITDVENDKPSIDYENSGTFGFLL